MGQIKFERLEQHLYPEQVGFRPNTPCYLQTVNFIFLNGGMGDYVAWMRAIQWIMSEATWLKGTLVGPKYFRELAQYWMRDYPNWTYEDYTSLNKMDKPNSTPFRGPVELARESLNATGAHLLTCGWVYFTNKEGPPSPEWDNYPVLPQDLLDSVELPAEGQGLHNYAVITTGQTTPSRKVPGHYWNPIIEYVKSKGLTPVFLGKSIVETGNARNIHTTWDGNIKFDGVDLRDKTTLLQAAAIMSKARVVIGHDNGLLHLAGCTNVPIVFGYNLASPKHREPRRPVGRVFNVTVDKSELACIHCQSNCNFLLGYNFQHCFYGDLKCLDLLFDKDGERWRSQIDLALQAL